MVLDAPQKYGFLWRMVLDAPQKYWWAPAKKIERAISVAHLGDAPQKCHFLWRIHRDAPQNVYAEINTKVQNFFCVNLNIEHKHILKELMTFCVLKYVWSTYYILYAMCV